MAYEELKDRICELEKELKTTKVNKRTEGAVGLLKAKIAKLKNELEEKLSKSSKKGEGFAVKKEGDVTIGFLGKPSVGKSTLLSKITNKQSKIGAYEFTTLDVVPGLLFYKFTNLQILDLPGIIGQAADNRGFGKKVLSVVRACDLVVFILDSNDALSEMKMLISEINKAGIRANQTKPLIEIKRKFSGGIQIPLNNSSKNISKEIIITVLKDMGFVNAEIIIHQKNLTIDNFIDSCYKNLEYKKAVICLNKIDLFSSIEIEKLTKKLKENFPKFEIFGVSAEKELNLEEFKEFIWRNLNFFWIYLKEQKKDPDFNKPLVLKKGDSIYDCVSKIHKDILKKFKFAKIKGKSVKFDWQRVGLKHKLKDGDIIEISAR